MSDTATQTGGPPCDQVTTPSTTCLVVTPRRRQGAGEGVLVVVGDDLALPAREVVVEPPSQRQVDDVRVRRDQGNGERAQQG